MHKQNNLYRLKTWAKPVLQERNAVGAAPRAGQNVFGTLYLRLQHFGEDTQLRPAEARQTVAAAQIGQ